MFPRKMMGIFVVALLVILSACGMPGLPVIGGPSPEPAAATAAMQTQIAGIVVATEAAQTPFINAVA